MTIRFVESELSCLEGRTISEQYPDEEAENVPFDLREEALLALREARNNASRRPGYRFLLEVADHAPIFGASSFEDHGFSFSANWDWLHPERVRIDLWTWSLDDMEHERAGRTLAKAYLALGGSARVRVNAQGEASA